MRANASQREDGAAGVMSLMELAASLFSRIASIQVPDLAESESQVTRTMMSNYLAKLFCSSSELVAVRDQKELQWGGDEGGEEEEDGAGS